MRHVRWTLLALAVTVIIAVQPSLAAPDARVVFRRLWERTDLAVDQLYVPEGYCVRKRALRSPVDLLVLGSPTQYHEATPDMLAWLDRQPPRALDGLPLAAFDTRYHLPRLLSGSAAQVIGQAVQKQGGKLIAPPESFFVIEREGPLEAGEGERAAGINALLDAFGAQAALRSGEHMS